MESRLKNIKRNTIWSILNKVVQIICPFIVRTVILYSMGAEYAGLSGLFTSVLRILSLTELGFASAITYNMYAPIAHKDVSKVCALLNLYRKIYNVLGMIILFLGLLMMPFLTYFIKGTYPDDVNLYFLFLLYLSNTCLSYFLFAYRTSLLNAYQRYDIISKIAIVCNLGMYICEMVGLIVFHNYYLYTASMVLFTVMNNIAVCFRTKRLFPEICCQGNVSEDILQNIKKKVCALLGHKIGSAVTVSADNIVISAFLGLTAVTIYNNYYLIISSIIGLIDIVSGGWVASIGNYLETKKDGKSLFEKMNFVIIWGVGWCTISFVCLVQDFIEVWVGKEYQYANFLTIILMGIYFYTWKIRSMILRFKEAAGMWNDDFWKPYVAAVVNIVLNVVLVQMIGINGVLISTIISMIFVNLPWEVHVLYSRLFKESEKNFYIELMVRTVLIVLSGFCTYLLCNIVTGNIYICFLIKIMICIAVPNFILLVILYRSQEFKGIVSLLKK